MSNRVVLITGGSKGIGREIARELSSRGDIVYICARNLEALEATRRMLDPTGTRVFAIQADVSDPDECRQAVDAVISGQGHLDVLVNNAGMAMRGEFAETEPAVMEAMVAINLLGPAYMTRHALAHLKESRGSVLFISSLAALHGLPRIALYGAGKGGLSTLSESLRAEVHAEGVHVGLIHVGFTENDPDKVVYASDGTLVTLSVRKNSQTQVQTARAIVRALDRRRNVVVLTGLGALAAISYRLFPRLSDFLIRRFAGRSSRYAETDRR